MRILVTGGRHYSDCETTAAALRRIEADAYSARLIHKLPAGPAFTLVHGDARGADRTAARAACDLGWTIEAHPADWDTHGRVAGPIRNQHMADAGADLLIAFPGGRGTADMVRRAEKAGIPVRRITKEA